MTNDSFLYEDIHTHTCFSDGRDTPEQLAEAAFARKMTRLGITDHGYAPYDSDCCMKQDALPEYQRRITALKEQYRGRMEIYCGIEQDLFSACNTEGCDYVIGSVHYLCLGGKYFAVDWQPEQLQAAAGFFGGDMLAVAEEYFRTVGMVVRVTDCDIIGHFDLISKLNGHGELFDEQHPRYVAAWQQAADQLLLYHRPFEINSGAIARGYLERPYPSFDMLRYLARRGAEFILSGDSHAKENLCYDFERSAALAAEAGCRLVSVSEIMRRKMSATGGKIL